MLLFTRRRQAGRRAAAIRDYLLKVEFPDYNINERYDVERIAQTFRLEGNGKIILIIVRRTFINDDSVSQISDYLRAFNLAQYTPGDQTSLVIGDRGSIDIEINKV